MTSSVCHFQSSGIDFNLFASELKMLRAKALSAASVQPDINLLKVSRIRRAVLPNIVEAFEAFEAFEALNRVLWPNIVSPGDQLLLFLNLAGALVKSWNKFVF